MHISLRSSLVAGIAAVGAGVIAVSPTRAPRPSPHRRPYPPTSLWAPQSCRFLPTDPSVGSTELLGGRQAIVGGANRAVAADRGGALPALPTLPFVPPACSSAS